MPRSGNALIGRRERLGNIHRRVARPAARPLLRVGAAQDEDRHGSEYYSGPKFSVVGLNESANERPQAAE
jgi:hypothetical protein